MKTKLILGCMIVVAFAKAQPWLSSGTHIYNPNAGNVGINIAQPTTLLDVFGGFTHMTNNSQGYLLPPSNGFGGLTVGWNRLGNSGAEVNFYNVYDNAPKSFLFSQKTGATTVADLMVIEGGGKVGIGTTAPENILHLSRLGDAAVRLEVTGQNAHKWDLLASSGQMQMYSGHFGLVDVTNNDAIRMDFNQAGNVAFGGQPHWNAKLNVTMNGSGEAINVFDAASVNTNKINFCVTHTGQTVIGHKSQNVSGHANAMLMVYGKAVATELYVTIQNWADFVFDKNYRLMPLNEVEKYIQQYKHLPNIPAAIEVSGNDSNLNLGEMQKMQMEKIEELFLHVIKQEKEIESLKKQNLELLKMIH